jgi:hypothetical protein
MEVGMVFPVLPGKTESLIAFAGRLMSDRLAEYEQSQESISKESWWIQPTPMGDLCIVHFVAEDPMAVFSNLGSSQEPFDIWFREQVLDNTGIDLTIPPPGMPMQIFGWERSK